MLDLFDKIVDLGLVVGAHDHRCALPRMGDVAAREELVEHAARLERPVVELVGELLLFLRTHRLGRYRWLGHQTHPALETFDDRRVVLGTTLETPHRSHVSSLAVRAANARSETTSAR